MAEEGPSRKKPKMNKFEGKETGLKENFDSLFGDIQYTAYLGPYATFKKAYTEQLEGIHKSTLTELNTPDCYIVTFVGSPDLLYIAYEKTPSQADYKACKYFHDLGHPMFTNTRSMYSEGRMRLKREWNKYMKATGRVPIRELMKFGCKFPCFCCGAHTFTLEDLDSGKCIVVENENQLNPFTEGIVLCKNCKEKAFF